MVEVDGPEVDGPEVDGRVEGVRRDRALPLRD